MNETAWKAIEEDKDRKIPTPPIRTPVQWYVAGEKNNLIPGIVTGIEGPGRVKLVVFPINSFPQHKAGVYYEGHKVHEQPGNPTTARCGSFGFEEGFTPPKKWYELHEQDIERRESALLLAEETAKKNAALYAQRQAEKESGQRKRLPEPLPAPTF